MANNSVNQMTVGTYWVNLSPESMIKTVILIEKMSENFDIMSIGYNKGRKQIE